jgi:hypothetical protein
VLDARVLTHIGSFEELYVFHQFSCKWLFGRRRACLLHGKLTKQGVLLWKTNSVLIGNQCAKCCSFKPRWFSLQRYMWFFNTAELYYWNNMRLFPPWKPWLAWSTPFNN